MRGEMRNAYKSLVAKPEWKRSVGRSTHSYDSVSFARRTLQSVNVSVFSCTSM
jgi:hypothetical protein